MRRSSIPADDAFVVLVDLAVWIALNE